MGSILGAAVPAELQARTTYLDPGRLRGEAFRSIVEVIEASANRRPMVLVFEDLHWADSATIDLATELLDVSERAPIGLIFVFRPRRAEPSWQVHEAAARDHPHIYREVMLEPLDDDNARNLVSSLLDVDGLPDRVRETILSKSEGNPFFLEEVIRSMIDQGMVFEQDGRWVASSDLADVSVPDTLAAVIVTRLDRLGDRPRTVAQAASVLGREFRYDELAAVLPEVTGVDDALVDLQRRDILREVARVPKRVFRFKHVLMQETVYSTVLLKRRTEMHASIGAFLERLQPDRVEDIADHFLAARLPDLALPHLVAAGGRALGAYALPEALQRFEGALEILDGMSEADPGVMRSVLEGLGRVREMRFDFQGAAQAYQRLREVGEQTGDVAMALSGKNKSALVAGMMLGNREAALSELAASEEAARASAEDTGLAEACMYQCFLRTAAAEFEQVEYYMTELTRLGEGLDDANTLLFGMVHLSNTLALALEADAAIEHGTQALAKAEEFGHLKFQAEVLTSALANAYLQRGEIAKAMECVERGMEIALRIGDRGSEVFAAIVQGQVAQSQGRFDDALALFRRAEEAAAATGMPPYMAVGRCVTGTCYQQIGGPYLERATEVHLETLQLAEMPMGDWTGAQVWAEVGRCFLAAGDVDRAEELFRMALDRRTMLMHIQRPAALRGLCDVALARGEVAEAERLLAELQGYVSEHSIEGFRIPLLIAEAQVARARGDHQEALGALDRCEALVQDQGFDRVRLDVIEARMASLKALGDTRGQAEAAAAAERVVQSVLSSIRDQSVRDAFSVSMVEMLEPAG